MMTWLKRFYLNADKLSMQPAIGFRLERDSMNLMVESSQSINRQTQSTNSIQGSGVMPVRIDVWSDFV